MQLLPLLKFKLYVVMVIASMVWTTAWAVESIVEEHTSDMFWLMAGIASFLGVSLIAVLQWVAISFMKDIKMEIKHIRAEYGLRIHSTELAIEALRTRQDVEIQAAMRKGGAE